MFRKISYLIALQFTGFVFLLFLINGVIFLAADLQNAKLDTNDRLLRTSELVLQRARIEQSFILPPNLRERVRVVDLHGRSIYEGALFSDIPFLSRTGVTDVRIQGESYIVMTASILEDGQLTGYVQIAELQRVQLGDLPRRAMIYFFVSVGVSLLTFAVGIFFARRSLLPAEQTMARLEQFTQDASHELRTPLAAVNSSLDLALKKREYEGGILSAKEDLRQITTLVERLLDLARLDQFALEKSPVDLGRLTSQVIDRYRLLAAEKRVQIVPDIRDGVRVSGDEALLRQVIGNLLANAIKFNHAGGQVRVRVTAETLSIADTGVGIPATVLPRIFDRFYRADSSRTQEGFGLGLALVKRIADLHGWSVKVESQPDKGTTFTLGFKST